MVYGYVCTCVCLFIQRGCIFLGIVLLLGVFQVICEALLLGHMDVQIMTLSEMTAQVICRGISVSRGEAGDDRVNILESGRGERNIKEDRTDTEYRTSEQ